MYKRQTLCTRLQTALRASSALSGLTDSRSSGLRRAGPEGRSQKKGYIGTVSTKTHSGDPDGTGGFGSFLGSGRFLALKVGFYKKFHRQNWLEIVGKQDFGPKKGYIGSWWFWWSPGWVLVLVVLEISRKFPDISRICPGFFPGSFPAVL